MSAYSPLRLCRPCARRRCEDRGPDCDTDCQCPCAIADNPDDIAAFARELRRVSLPFGEIYTETGG